MLAAAVAVLPLLVGSGCVVSRARYDAEHQKVLDLQKELEAGKSALKTQQDALAAKVAELTKKTETDVAAAKAEGALELKKQALASQAAIKSLQDSLARAEQVAKTQVAALGDRAKELSDKVKEVNMLKDQLKAEQEKVLKLTKDLEKASNELEAAKKAAQPEAK